MAGCSSGIAWTMALEVIKGPGSLRQISMLSVWDLPSGSITANVWNGPTSPVLSEGSKNYFPGSPSHFLSLPCPWQEVCGAMVWLSNHDAPPGARSGAIFPWSTGLHGGRRHLNKIGALVGKRRRSFCIGPWHAADSRTADTKAGWWVSNVILCEKEWCYTM